MFQIFQEFETCPNNNSFSEICRAKKRELVGQITPTHRSSQQVKCLDINFCSIGACPRQRPQVSSEARPRKAGGLNYTYVHLLIT